MPATKEQMGASTSGMDYGQKGQFMSALQGPGSGGAQTGTPPVGAPPVAPDTSDPLGMLLGGALAPTGDPVTAGLSVGPGPGPTAPQRTPDAVADRLRLVAQHAKTPMLRAQARAALLRRVRAKGQL